MKSIKVIAMFNSEGPPVPIKFKVENKDDESMVIKIDKIIQTDLNRFAGNKMYKYKCETYIFDKSKLFTLAYELDTCKWFLQED